MSPARTALSALPLLLAACASAPTTSIASVEPLRFVESALFVRRAARGLERSDFVPILEEDAAANPRRVSIRARFLALDPGLAEQMLGAQAAALVSIVVPREQSERLLADLERAQPGIDLVGRTELVLHERQEGCISVTDRRAFVSGFTLRSSGHAALADPQVDVAMQGNQLVATGTLDESGAHVTLDLRLDVCRLDEEFAELELALAGADVTIQEPRGLLQSLSTTVSLGRDEALLIGGVSPAIQSSQGTLFVLVEAEEFADPVRTDPAPVRAPR